MGSSQCGWKCEGTPLLLQKEKEKPVCKVYWSREEGRGVHGLDLAEILQDLLLQWRSVWAFLHVCLGRVMCARGTIETTNNSSSTKWLALIKSRLLWFYLSAVITRNCVMSTSFFAFSFASNRFPVLTLTDFHEAWGIYQFDGAASVLWEDFQFLFKSLERVMLSRLEAWIAWKIACISFAVNEVYGPGPSETQSIYIYMYIHTYICIKMHKICSMYHMCIDLLHCDCDVKYPEQRR